MRIAFVGPFGLEPKGTMGVRALPLAKELVRLGHEVKIIMPPYHLPQEGGRAWQEDGVSLEYVHLRIPFTSTSLLERALDWRPGVVHCFKPKAFSGAAGMMLWWMRRLRMARARLVMDEDDWEGRGGWNELGGYPAVMRAVFAWQERWGLTHADAVTVASRTLQSLVWSLGMPPQRVHYLPNGASATRWGDGAHLRHDLGLRDDTPIVLLYTRFFEFDVARAVAVFSSILQQEPEARLLVVGKGLYAEDDARFDACVSQAGLGDRVVRAGWVDQDALGEYFSAANVALYPFDDTLINRCKCAVKVTDLLAAGVPVVADAVGQNAEYIEHNESGLLSPCGDVAAMANAAVEVLRDAALARRLGEGARLRIAQHFAWPMLAEALSGLYERLLGH